MTMPIYGSCPHCGLRNGSHYNGCLSSRHEPKYEPPPITEQRIREIVREELEKINVKPA